MSVEKARIGSARIVLSDLVPDGRNMVEVIQGGDSVICVRRGEMSEALMEEWNQHLEHATRTGRVLGPETDEEPAGHPPL
ncbi:hypothetical protein [Streptomyces arboris]|uniref:hypothetical protein n=1 Tax=Streptomyces arboris TaxID=2600619 RepID=UPI003BF58782